METSRAMYLSDAVEASIGVCSAVILSGDIGQIVNGCFNTEYLLSKLPITAKIGTNSRHKLGGQVSYATV
jgi:hypothetical protein